MARGLSRPSTPLRFRLIRRFSGGLATRMTGTSPVMTAARSGKFRLWLQTHFARIGGRRYRQPVPFPRDRRRPKITATLSASSCAGLTRASKADVRQHIHRRRHLDARLKAGHDAAAAVIRLFPRVGLEKRQSTSTYVDYSIAGAVTCASPGVWLPLNRTRPKRRSRDNPSCRNADSLLQSAGRAARRRRWQRPRASIGVAPPRWTDAASDAR